MDKLADRMPGPLWSRVAIFLIMCGDFIALLGALLFSSMLRFDGMPLPQIYHTYLSKNINSIPFVLISYTAIFWSFRLYRYAWRFAGLETLKGVICGNTIGLFALIGLEILIDRHTLPRSVLIIFWMSSIAAVGSVRVILRLMSLGRTYGRRAIKLLKKDLSPKRILILGSGSNGARLLNALREEMTEPYKVIGILDDRASRHGVYIHDVRVLGPMNYLYQLLGDDIVDEVLIALPDASGAEIREYVMACRKRKIPVKVIPGLHDVLNDRIEGHIEEISVEDLLRRPPVCANMAEVGRYLVGKCVLVTGAGGSIGSELCRQIVALKPASIILLGHGENSIHQIYQELIHKSPKSVDALRVVIASVVDEARINQVFREHRPDVVFHAAAHKHVPIMELNVLEAVQNNVIGTNNVAEACGRHGVSRMVLISSDKAVYPSSIMGATKRACEELVRSISVTYPKTSFVTVRFGNVLGSRGSVVPIFHEQIKRGGPITITHPEMTRYFMSIPEAVQLVLTAGAIGESGHLYVLDMGEPIKVLDLAHDMIRLCGYEPEVDISVLYTGIRPGEKLHEALTETEETLVSAPSKGLSIVYRPEYLASNDICEMLEKMQKLISSGKAKETRDLLQELIPGFTSRTLIS